MRVRLGAALASALTVGIGVVTLAGLILAGNDFDLNENFVSATRGFTKIVLQVVTITVALTILIGVANLLFVHFRRILGRKGGAVYSLFLIASFALVIGIYIRERDNPKESMILLETVQVSVESALAGLVFFALVYGAYRMMRHRVTWTGTLFTATLLVVLLGALPFSRADAVRDLRDWILEIPVSAGARGFLLGIALATIVTGVYVLVGVDRSYRE